MNKQEFIDRLRAALNGRVSPNLVNENVNYYEDYINTEIRKGRTEEEVLQTLGDPRLIARTIIETNGNGSQTKQQGSGYGEAGYQEGYRSSNYQNSAGYQSGAGVYQEEGDGRKIHLPGWLWAVIAIIVFAVVISAVMSILSFLAPVLIVFFVVVFLVKLFRDWLN